MGKIKWINLRASPRQTSQGAVLWDGIMTDITQNKLAETEIKLSREQLAELIFPSANGKGAGTGQNCPGNPR